MIRKQTDLTSQFQFRSAVKKSWLHLEYWNHQAMAEKMQKLQAGELIFFRPLSHRAEWSVHKKYVCRVHGVLSPVNRRIELE